MDQPPQYPVSDINLVLRACDPAEPLPPGDERYADFTDLRQGEGIAPLRASLQAPPVNASFHHSCLCGHRGCGKSTELLALKQWADENGFLAAHTEVDEHFGMIDLQFSDLFLLAATVAEDAMRDFGHPLPAERVRRVVKWFAEVSQQDEESVQSELAAEAGAQAEAGLPFLGKLFAKFTAGTRAGSSHVVTTRQRIQNYPDTLVDLTNEVLRAANETLAEHGRPRGLLIIFDNLDRYDPEHIHRALFRAGSLIGRLHCHAVFTMPVSLEYEPPDAIQDPHGFPTMLPMLALRRRQDTWARTVEDTVFADDALASVRDALARRVDIEAVFEDPADADLVVKMSGGCVRDLMHLVTLPFRYAGEASVFTRQAVRTAIQRMRATYVRRLTDEDYLLLAQIARREHVPRDDLTIRLLFHRFALEYLDQDGEPWMDVHPLVVETEGFQRALKSGSPLAQS